MATLGKWNKKKFTVDKKKIYRPESISSSSKGTRNETTNLPNGKEPYSVNFSIHVGIAVGVDVRKEVGWWEKNIGKSDALVINGKRFGPKEFILDSVDADMKLANNGKIHEATINLSFSQTPRLSSVIKSLTTKALADASATDSDKEKHKILNINLERAKIAATQKYKRM
jgi:hypothetical protein